MRNLDLYLGTHTHFHDTEKYEDRLDSQTVTPLFLIQGHGNITLKTTYLEK